MIFRRRDRETFNLQSDLLVAAARKIVEWQDLTLATTRSARDMAVSFRVCAEVPEVDVRDELDALIRELDDQVARLEEQIVA